MQGVQASSISFVFLNNANKPRRGNFGTPGLDKYLPYFDIFFDIFFDLISIAQICFLELYLLSILFLLFTAHLQTICYSYHVLLLHLSS